MFQVGQRVECIKRGGWINLLGERSTGPSFGDICTVTNVEEFHAETYLYVGWGRDRFISTAFRPLTDSPKAVKETMRKHFNKFLDVKESA